MLEELKIIWSTQLGRALLACVTAAPLLIWLAVDQFRQLRADLKYAHDRLNSANARASRSRWPQ
jgi:putative copper export protein